MIRTVNREPAEHTARLEATLDLVNPLVIERHPRWTVLALPVTRLRSFPEVWCVHVLHKLDRVESPATLHGQTPNPESPRENGTLRGRTVVQVTAEEKHDRAEKEDDGRKGVCEVEADILL